VGLRRRDDYRGGRDADYLKPWTVHSGSLPVSDHRRSIFAIARRACRIGRLCFGTLRPKGYTPMSTESTEEQGDIGMAKVLSTGIDESIVHCLHRAFAIENHQIEYRSYTSPLDDILDAEIVFAGGHAKTYLPCFWA
jgi:hypothetical protein